MVKIIYQAIRYLRYTRIILWTTYNYFKLWVRGIKIGRKVLFDGNLRIVRFPTGGEIQIGNNCKFNSSFKSNLIGINHRCIISTNMEGASIKIGDGCGFSGSVIASFKNIKIGNNVRFGANTLITDSDWHLDDSRIGTPRPVIIKDNVWLGYNAIVLKGVTIGANSIIGAGSVIVKDIPENVIAGGNPCKVIKPINK